MKKTNGEYHTYIKIGPVIGSLYLASTSSQKVIIYAKGGPSFGDNGKATFWKICKDNGYSLLIPDYLGYCRSEGKFTFKGCIETLSISEKFIVGKLEAIDLLTGKKIKIKSKNNILIGSSWGGAIVPFFDQKSCKSIKAIGLIKPVTDWVSQGKNKTHIEENPEEMINLTKSVYKNIYKGFEKSPWPDIIRGKIKKFNPINNVNLLKNIPVYIAHGNRDKSVYWKKSSIYFKKLISEGNKKTTFKLLKNCNHGSSSTNMGVKFILESIVKHNNLS